MATIFPKNFASNSFTGSVVVRNGHANVILPTNPYALEGNKQFVVRLRKNSTSGFIVATSPQMTIVDTSTVVSLTANVSSVAEGNLVSFTLVTANAMNGSGIFYSAYPVTANLTISDFLGGNTGVFPIVNNQATFVLRANTDAGFVDETGEKFGVQIRTNSAVGDIVYSSSNVEILDIYKLINVLTFVEAAANVTEGSNVTFTIHAHNANGITLYYSTSGNITSSNFVYGNTGSFIATNDSITLGLPTLINIPYGQFKSGALVLRRDSNSGEIVATSNVISIRDTSLDPSVPVASFSNVLLSSPNGRYIEGANIDVVVPSANANAYIMYYSTEGNVTNSSFVFGNTGSFTVTQNSTNIQLISNANIPLDEERHFTLQIRHDSPTGLLVATSNTVILVDSANAFMSATGGTQSNISNYRLHTFTTSANLTIVKPGKLNQIEYLVVGGGGTGGNGATAPTSPTAPGGGGGAGGVLTGTFAPPTAFAPGITATVGAASGLSSLLTATAAAGGAGGNRDLPTTPFGTGFPGGSGGGAAGGTSLAVTPGGAGTPGQGNPGGENNWTPGFAPLFPQGAGGGGATTSGAPSSTSGGGPGGAGYNSNTLGFSSGVLAGGGGGATNNPSLPLGVGGTGGGGDGAHPTLASTGGTVNTGGGGGGGTPGYVGSLGGSGIVVIRYRTS